MPFPPSRALAAAAILTAAAVVPSRRAAGADDPAALAKTALAAIAADEAAVPAGRFTIGVAEHRARWENGEAVSAMRKRLANERAVHAEGSFIFTAEGWKKDLSIPKSDLNPAPTRTRTAELSGMLRFLVETTTQDGPRSRGLVTRSPFSAPGDAVLAHKVAHSLEGVHWTKARSEGELLILEGERDSERHVVTMRRANGYHLKSWDLVRTVVDPTGSAAQQLYF